MATPVPTYDLPDAAIAQQPIEPRDAARLLVDGGAGVAPTHRRVTDLPDLVGPGDLLVLNETRVLPARLRLHKATGGVAEVLLLEAVEGSDAAEWVALVRPGRRLAPGTRLHRDPDPGHGGPGLAVEVGERLDGGRRLVRLLVDGEHSGQPTSIAELLERYGEMPLPPYLTEGLDDPSRYQTVFARHPGSVAAPTAGLHLTHGVLDRCRAAGAEVATIDLAVGLDTFRPVADDVDDLDDHELHSERYLVPEGTLDAAARATRVIAVGTTSVRALESAARGDSGGRTQLFIRDPFDWQVVDGLITNFHQPRSTLLALIEAFIGPRWRDLYTEALAEGYRFLSFGDAMFLERSR